ncbi:putative cadmium-transporting ATPase [Candidatus Rubidus massiliensis]|nr:putative cadmium-transporting ATPase [Candidatus Rubidus massiliensis]
MTTSPLIFQEYFELGQEEYYSPFLKKETRKYAFNLTLRSSLFAGFLLFLSFCLSFYPQTIFLSHFFLVFVYFFAGIPALIESIEDLVNFDINIDILMTLAAFSSILIGSGLEGGLLLVLFSLSGAMEDAVTQKAQSAISSLNRLSPNKATFIQQDGTIIERSIQDINVGDKILVRSGQMIPLDGVILEGSSSVNLAHLTGENFPIFKTIGEEVPSGGRNLEGALVIKVIRTSADSTLAKIIQLVTEAQEAKPTLQRWFDNLSRAYALTIISLSGLFAITFPYLLSIPFLGEEGSIYRALAFLIAASPCALIIAIPIAYLSAISICAKKGILLKGGMYLDAFANCKAIAFDKTGTLTTGDLSVKDIFSLTQNPKISNQTAFAIAFSLEKNAMHPIAKAIVNYAQENKILGFPLHNFQAISGFGLKAEITINEQRKEVLIGNESFIEPSIPKEQKLRLEEKITEAKRQGLLVAVLKIENDLFLLTLEDVLRPKIAETIHTLIHKDHLEIYMLTGDHAQNAEKTAHSIGISNFFAELKPEDKLLHVSQLAKTKGLAMIGDGINDAPALARATVGICMGKVGTTAAMDAADIILLQDNVELLSWLYRKSKNTQAVVKQNLTLAVGAILLAALPALAGFIPLWLAVILHEGGTVLVGLNALRLLRS